jgi:predicted dehydrogenase
VKTYRVGLVGAGIMGKLHARIFQADPRCELVAVSDNDIARAQAFGAEFKIPAVFGSHQEMLAGADLDIVTVCTPDHAHRDPVVDCANAGVHVVVEKPLATSLADCEAIISAAERNHVKVMAQFSHRWIPAYRQTKDLAMKGELGEPVLAYTRKNDRIFVPTEMIKWSNQTTPAWFLCSHDLDLVCWYFDSEPAEVYANAVKKVLVNRGIDTPDAVQAQVRFVNGAVGTFEACWIYPDTYPTMTDSFIEVVFTDGMIHMERKQEQIEVATPKSYTWPRSLISYPYEDGELHGAIELSLNHFVKCVHEDREPLVTLQSSLRVTRILDAVQRSIETARPISL